MELGHHQKASGTQSHTEPRVNGFTQHYFANATQTITPGVGDALFTYVLIDPCNPPQEIMLQWSDGPSWEHRAYWGANVINGGTDGTNSRRRMGDLPIAGQWVRLEVPASQVGMETVTITGMAFTMSDGHAWWDRAGKKPAGSGMLQPKSPVAMVASLDGPAIEAAPTQSLMGRVLSWLQRPTRRRSMMRLELVPTMSFAEPHATTAGGEKSRYSLYSPELNLLAEQP